MDRLKPPLRTAVALLALVWLACPPASRALDPRRAITQYGHDVWGLEQGLPQDSVQAIRQTRDGYLWLGTEEGLVRFDGVRFTVFDRRNTPEFTDNYISALAEDRTGALWIGTRQGGLMRLDKGIFTSWTRREGLPNEFVRCLTEDSAGRLWIGTDGGLARWTGRGFEVLTTHDGLSSDSVRSISEGAGGDLWIGTRGGGLDRLHGSAFTAYRKKDGLPSDDIWSTLVARDGTLWIGTAGAGLAHLVDGHFSTVSSRDGLRSDFVDAIVEDRQGNLWVGTDGGGLSRFSGGTWTTYASTQGLSNDFIQALAEDREGSLWIGTQGGGVNRLEDQKFTLYSSREGLSRDTVWSIYEDREGAMWIGTLGGGLNRIDDQGVHVFTTRDGLPSDAVWSTLETADGSLWVGTRGGGLARWKDGKFTTYGTKDGLAGDIVLCLLEDHRGTLWIGTTAGLTSYEGGRFTKYPNREGLATASVLSLLETHRGDLLVGLRAGGVSRLVDGKLTNLTTARGLSQGTVFDMHEDAAGDIWCGTAGGGLIRLGRGGVRAYGSKEGLFDDVIYRILEDAAGNFWMSCNRGVFRVNRRDLDRYDQGSIRTIPSVSYSRPDGLRNPECNGGFQPAGWRSHDGRLWFPTIAGAAVIDPARTAVNRIPPPVVLEGFLADGKTLPLQEGLRMAPGSANLEFHYTGLSFLAPERVLFRYRLDGFDPDWVDAAKRRVAYYTNLPSGHYTFRVVACNDAGMWSPRGASFAFFVQPHFYRTPWFYLLCLVAAAFLGEGAYVLRVKTLKARQKELEGLVAERTRQLAEANQVLERLSLVDPLTGISNRRQFERVLDFERRRSSRTGSPLALLMIDIDEFKILNDAFGHQAGDECLKRVASELTNCVRGSGDIVARYGGEEFAVVLPGADTEGAMVLAERIRGRVEALKIPLGASRPGQSLTVSVGVAGVDRPHELSAEALVGAADQALYRAKQNGRNRVEESTSPLASAEKS